jgi:TRAP-type C4-dicarboxylate transport system substrate-binding protein
MSLVQMFPTQFQEGIYFNKLFVDRVNEKARGELKIIVKGGPEVMNPFDQPLAVQEGILDMSNHVATFLSNIVPGTELFRATRLTPKERRANGAFDYMRRMYAKAGLYLVGTSGPSTNDYFYMISKTKMEQPEDFKGKRVAGTPPFFPFLKGLGMVPVPISGLKDYYPGLERGVFEAHISPYATFITLGTCELAKYLIDDGYYTNNQILIMNLKKWQSLPQHLQDLMHEAIAEFERRWDPIWEKIKAERIQKLRDAGVELYHLSPEVADWYITTALDTAWADAAKKHSPELIADLKKLLRP